MARKLNTYVTVNERDDDGNPTGRSGTFGPADDLPDWAEAAIDNPDVWADQADQAAAAEPGAGDEVGGEVGGADAYTDMKVDDLRAELAKRDLPTSGTKPELQDRLRAADATPPAQ